MLDSGEKWRKYQLVIEDTRASDRGMYICQVDTLPALVMEVTLSVTGK